MSLLFLRVIFLGCASASTANGAANGEAGPWDEHWENHENLQSSSKTWSDARHQVLQDDRVLPVWPAGGSPASPSGPWLEQTSEEKWLKRELLKEAHWLQHKHLVYKLPEGSAEQHAVLAQHAHDVVHGADMTYPDDPERRGHLRHKHSTGDKGSQERASLLSQFKAMQRMQPSYPGLVLSASRSNSRSNSSTSHRVAEPEKEAAQLQEEERQLRKEREKLQEEMQLQHKRLMLYQQQHHDEEMANTIKSLKHIVSDASKKDHDSKPVAPRMPPKAVDLLALPDGPLAGLVACGVCAAGVAMVAIKAFAHTGQGRSQHAVSLLGEEAKAAKEAADP